MGSDHTSPPTGLRPHLLWLGPHHTSTRVGVGRWAGGVGRGRRGGDVLVLQGCLVECTVALPMTLVAKTPSQNHSPRIQPVSGPPFWCPLKATRTSPNPQLPPNKSPFSFWFMVYATEDCTRNCLQARCHSAIVFCHCTETGEVIIRGSSQDIRTMICVSMLCVDPSAITHFIDADRSDPPAVQHAKGGALSRHWERNPRTLRKYCSTVTIRLKSYLLGHYPSDLDRKYFKRVWRPVMGAPAIQILTVFLGVMVHLVPCWIHQVGVWGVGGLEIFRVGHRRR